MPRLPALSPEEAKTVQKDLGIYTDNMDVSFPPKTGPLFCSR